MEPVPPPNDPSLDDLQQIKDANNPEPQRHAAFDRMLRRDSGWWGPGRLAEHAEAYTEVVSARLLSALDLPSDRIDVKAVAHDALLALRSGASRIETDVRMWFRGVIWNLVKRAMDEEGIHLNAIALDEELPAPMADPDSDDTSAQESLRQTRLMVRAFEQLTPSLRDVAFPLYVNGFSRKEVQELLGISAATLRKRISRLLMECRRIAATLGAGKTGEPKAPAPSDAI